MFEVDENPPAAITNLSALTGASDGQINLTWTAPGDNGSTGNITGGKYRIKWSTYTVADWDSGTWTDYANKYSVELATDTVPSQTCGRLVTGLTGGVTYYFRIWTRDETDAGWSAISNGATTYARPDDIAPAAITNLTASCSTDGWGIVTLTWTAPKEDGASGGASTSYELRYLNSDFTGNWSAGIPLSSLPVPAAPGVTQSYAITGLVHGATYYFHIKSTDDNGNVSPLDTGTTAQALVRHILISEVQIAGAVAGNDFVELYNPTPYSVDLNGLQIRKMTTAGTGSSVVTWSASTIMPPLTYRLWANNAWTPSAPADDATTTTLSTDESLAIRITATGSNIDMFAWGSGHTDPFVEGTPFATNPAANRTLERKALSGSTASNMDPVGYGGDGSIDVVSGNAYDSNDNSADFVYSSTNTPQNSLSSREPDVAAPNAISDLTATAGSADGDIKLSWTAPYDDWNLTNAQNKLGYPLPALYRVKYALQNITDFDNPPSPNYTFDVSTTNVTPNTSVGALITGLNPGTTYYFAIKTRDDSGHWSSWSTSGVNNNNRGAARDLVPTAPTVSVTSVSSWTATITWTNNPPTNIDDLVSVKIYYAAESFATGLEPGVTYFGIYDKGDSPKIITGLADMTEYFIRLKAVDLGDQGGLLFSYALESAFSTQITTTTLDGVPPGAVTGFSAALVCGGDLSLAWTSPGSNGYSGTLNDGSRFHIATTTVLSNAENPAYWTTAVRDSADIQIATASISPGMTLKTGPYTLTAGVTYYFRIWTKDAAGNWSGLSVGATQYYSGTAVGHTDGDREAFNTLAAGGAYGGGTNIVYAKTAACGRLFLLRGQTDTAFYEYDIPGNAWAAKAALPAAAGTGSAMVWVSTGSGVGQSWLYTFRGGTGNTEFYRYNVEGNSWETMTAAPVGIGGGAALAWDGGNNIYAFRGDDIAGGPFWRYNIPNNRWNNAGDGGDPTDFGVAIGAGGSLTWDGTYVYGSYSSYFKRYNPSTNQWENLDALPASFGAGGSILYTGGKSIYAVRGGGNTDFWHYDTETSSWVVLPSLPLSVGTNSGNRLAFHSEDGALDHLYIWRGLTTTTLWCFRRDIDAPSTVNNLTASVPEGSCGNVRLEWSAPYGDGDENGLTETSQVWIQYSDMDVGWNRETAQIKFTTGPVNAGAACAYEFTVPQWGVSYYFRIWTGDKVKNWSSASNSGGPVSVMTTKTLAGKVTNGETGQPASGIAVGIAGFRNGRTLTDAGGNYSFTVPACRHYTIMPSSAAMYFTTATASGINSSYPDRYEFTTLPDDHANLDFVAHPAYGNLYYSSDTLSTTDLSGATKKLSLRFTANDTRTYNRAYAYNSTSAGSDSYVFELRGDDGQGYPGVLVSSTTTNISKTAGWGYAAGSWSLTKGTTYHLVIYSTYTAASDYKIRKSAPLSFNRPTDAEPDFAANVLDYGFSDNPDSWKVRNFTPLYIFYYAAAPYYQEGNPFGILSTGSFYQVRGSTCVGQTFKVDKSSVAAKAFHFWVRRSAVAPESNLTWSLLGPNDHTNVLASGLLASPSDVSTDFNWQVSEQTVECPAVLNQGSTYWIVLRSTGSSSGYYEFATLNHGDSVAFRDAITYRGLDSTLVRSVDDCANFTADGTRDAIFRVRRSTVVTGGPKTITDLRAQTSLENEGAVDLDWTFPGICGHVDLPIGSRYYIQHSTHLDAPFAWNVDAAQTIISTGPVLVGEHQFYTKTSLDEGNTYYFTVWYFHYDFNVTSLVSNVATTWASLIPPSAVTNLTALPAPRGRAIDLAWTAPGDNYMTGDITGGAYRLKYSTYVDGGDSFWDGGQWSNRTYKYEMIWSTDTSPGNDEALNITALSPGTTYYFRLWTRDRFEDNWSDISNGATSWAQTVNLSVYILDSSTYNFGALPTQISTISINGVIVRNDGNVNASYLLRIATGTVPPSNTTWDTSTTIGADRFVLKTMFKDAQPLDGDFGAVAGDDVLTLEDIYATDVNFSDGTHEGRYIEPFLVAPLLSDTTIWFRLSTPLSTSTTEYQTIPVVITSEETYP